MWNVTPVNIGWTIGTPSRVNEILGQICWADNDEWQVQRERERERGHPLNAKCLKMFHLTYFLFTVKFWHFSSAAFVEKNRRTGTYASDTKNRRSLLPGVCARGSKRPHSGYINVTWCGLTHSSIAMVAYWLWASCAHHRLRSAVLHDTNIGAPITIMVKPLTGGHYTGRRSMVVIMYPKGGSAELLPGHTSSMHSS